MGRVFDRRWRVEEGFDSWGVDGFGGVFWMVGGLLDDDDGCVMVRGVMEGFCWV